MNDLGPVDTFTAKVQAAQADLQHGIDRAGLRDDPFRHPLQALSSVMGLFPVLVGQLTDAVDQARQPIDPVAVEQAAVRGADRRAAELARSRSRRTLLTYGGVLLAAVAVAGSLGFAWGQAVANATVYQTQQQLALAFRDGPSAAAIWANLMRSNDANMLLATCTGLAVRTLEGRKACNMPVWLDPPNQAVPTRAR